MQKNLSVQCLCQAGFDIVLSIFDKNYHADLQTMQKVHVRIA